MKAFFRIMAVCGLLMLLFCLVPSQADFGDFSGGSDFGGGSSSSSSSSDWNYSSSYDGSGSDMPDGVAAVITIVGLGIFAYNVINAHRHRTPSKNLPGRSTWGFQLKPINDFKDARPEAAWLEDLYRNMQDAWGAGDMTSLQPYFTADCYAQYERQLRAKNKRGEKAHCEVHSVKAELLGWNEDQYEYMLAVSMRAVITAWNTDADGKIVSGSDRNRKEMHYAWVLRKSKTAQTAERYCPNCGALLDINQMVRCPHCDALLEQPGSGWALSSIQGISQTTL